MFLSFMKVGDLLHFHPFAPTVGPPKTTPVGRPSKGSAEPPASRRRDDLAFLGLSLEGGTVDPRASWGSSACSPAIVRPRPSTTSAGKTLGWRCHEAHPQGFVRPPSVNRANGSRSPAWG